MVASPKVIKSRKESVKISGSLKKQNIMLNSNLKFNKFKKRLKQGKSTNFKTVQVSTKNEKFGDLKSINVQLCNQEETNSMKKPISRQPRKKRICEFNRVQFAEANNHVKNKKSQNVKNTEMNSDTVSKHVLKRKYSEENTIQSNENTTSQTNAIFKIVQSQKQKRVNNINAEENTDCLNLSDLSKEHVLQCISAIYHLTEEQLKSNNALFDDESQPVFMQVTCIRVPKTPKRCMRILLPNSIVSPNDEVALFVGDLQRGRRKDYEPTVEYYENLLNKHGSTKIKNIIPMNQVKTEYDQYELKRKLVGSYDYFLVDGKIAGHLFHLLGKEFYKKRKLPTSIKMQSKDLKHEIEYALKKTVMQIHSCGDTHVIQIGHTSMKKEEILENILTTCSYLSKNYPGGWANIRSIRIKTSTSLSLPIYTTLKNKCLVKMPIVQPKRPKAYHNVSGELSTVPGIAAVTVTPSGDIIVEKKEKGSLLKRGINKTNKKL